MDAVCFEKVPSLLKVVVSNDEYAFAGIYVSQSCTAAGGWPLWRQLGASKWLFLKTNGHWGFFYEGEHIGEGKDFQTDISHIGSAAKADGRMPHEMALWTRYSDGSFKEDDDIAVKCFTYPAQLKVVVSNDEYAYAGAYALQNYTAAGGLPLWRKLGADKWLFMKSNGHWGISSEDEHIGEGKDFQTSISHISSAEDTNGRTPHEMALWKRYIDGSFREDRGISVEIDVSVAIPGRIADIEERDFTIAPFLGPEQLAALPDLSFREAMASPVRTYCFNSDILRQIELRAEQILYGMPDFRMSSEKLKAIVAYTFDDLSGRPEKQPYCCLNKELRKRSAQDRKNTIQIWGPYLKLLLTALDELPDVEMEVWRGLQDRVTVEQQYKVGRPIQWGAFTSTTKNVNISMGFVDQVDGVLLRLQVTMAKDISQLSFLPQEDELLLSPNAIFRASRKPQTVSGGPLHGWMVLDMAQDTGSKFYS